MESGTYESVETFKRHHCASAMCGTIKAIPFFSQEWDTQDINYKI